MELQVDVASAGGTPLVSVAGELDAVSAPDLDAVLAPLLDAAGPDGLVLDLSDVTFLDSSGLGVCIKAIKRVRERGGQVALVVITPRVLKVLEITGIDQAVTVASTADEALAAVR